MSKMEPEYKKTEYRYRFLKEATKYFNLGPRRTENCQGREKTEVNLCRTEQNFLESIRKDTVCRKETIKEIVLQCSATSFEIYLDEIKRLSWENSKLQEELRKKNEQIRKISQELEKTSSELKKVKTGRNKENDQPKKDKKVPVLTETSHNDPISKNARDIFFYDIPKFWSEEDVRMNLMKLGTVLRLQIRGQYKYKTVKAKIALNENFEKVFKEGHFGICISKNFIRWYDTSLGLKGRQERGQWQTVKDLTNEEMDEIRKGELYDFTKKLQQTSNTAFIKIIKITKNWKVIGYFKNLKKMEEAVEDSCTIGDINKVWLVRNKKTIYKDGDDRSKMMKKNKEKEVEAISKKSEELELKETTSEPKTPMMPPDRIYRELGNFASRKESLLHPSKEQLPLRKSKTPNEDQVVDMIKNWRLNEEDKMDHNSNLEKDRQQSPLRKDNVAPETVVDVIKDYRTTNKIKYVQYQESTHDGSIIEKLMEVKGIFEQTSNEMEWEKINTDALKEVCKDKAETLKDMKAWAMEKNNFFRLGQRIIDLAEQSKIFQEYTTLNDDFIKRLKNENRYQDEKGIREKRPILESPSKWSEIEEDEERNRVFKEAYVAQRQKELLMPSTQMEFDEDTEEEEEEKIQGSPSKENNGKKKKRKGKKKKH
ncbi:hypothetical protein RhiirA4_480668 [Rhizophagus irregularis]|uniref:Uncharacterized protein n=1 Tax=Rhizophagus irregularis TaxID=588596 RepID=A0A2I1HIB5_9GLOM|nr:hypothetical protein RhiirA4_480668 [Rhizophagus irregularis]